MAGYIQAINGEWWPDVVQVNGEGQATITDINGADPSLCRDLLEYTIAPQQGCLYVFDFSETTFDGSNNVTFCPCLIPYDANTNNPIQSGHLVLGEFLNGTSVIRPMLRSLISVNYKYNTNLTNGLGETERTVANGNISGMTPTGLRNPTGTTLDNATFDTSRAGSFLTTVPPQFIVGQLFQATSSDYSGPEIVSFGNNSNFTFQSVNYKSNAKGTTKFSTNNQRMIVGNQPLHSNYENNFILEGGPEGTADGTTNNRTVSGTIPFRTDLSQICTGDPTLWTYKQNTTSTIRVVFAVTINSTGLRNIGNYGGNRGWRIRLSTTNFLQLIYQDHATSGSARNTRTWNVSDLDSESAYTGDGHWNLLHLTIDNSQPTVFEMFLNGTSLGTNTVSSGRSFQPWRGTTNRSLSPYTTQWGTYFSGEGWRGYLAEVGEYDHLFNSTEISNDFTAFKAKYWTAV